MPIQPSLPHAWSELTWQQLCDCWRVKIRYGGNADVARVAALLSLCGLSVCRNFVETNKTTGETIYRLRDADGNLWTVTAREAAQMAKQTLSWFDYPYGDPGEKEVRDEKGKVVKEHREAVAGYVSPMHDAMILPKTEFRVGRRYATARWFALPQVACNNLTWQQYRSLQAITPQLFSENVTEEQVIDLQAQFLAHCLVPRTWALFDTAGGSIRFRPHYEYHYNAEQAEGLAKWWKKKLSSPLTSLFHICLQCYQTALTYYAFAYPLLFSGESKSSQVRDALQGEVGTINTIMKYAGYAEQQQVYDSNLPFVLDILNTMTKEAKEIEKMNAKIKKNNHGAS